ncbi:MAG: uroporphyrinogen-III synthase [Gemmatimonadota bacterium]
MLVTRPIDPRDPLALRLAEAGASVVHLPLIRIAPPTDPAPLWRAIGRLDRFHWVVLTSPNGARAFLDAAAREGLHTLPSRLKVAAVGPGTARAIRDGGVEVDLQPKRFVAEGLLAALKAEGISEGTRVLLPRPARARDALPKGLRALGAVVEEVEAYCTELVDESGAHWRELFQDGKVDWILFTSSSAVESFHQLSHGEVRPLQVGVIGPATAATAREHGFPVDLEAPVHTLMGLADALVERYSR